VRHLVWMGCFVGDPIDRKRLDSSGASIVSPLASPRCDRTNFGYVAVVYTSANCCSGCVRISFVLRSSGHRSSHLDHFHAYAFSDTEGLEPLLWIALPFPVRRCGPHT
jgi:hypothetical protein